MPPCTHCSACGRRIRAERSAQSTPLTGYYEQAWKGHGAGCVRWRGSPDAYAPTEGRLAPRKARCVNAHNHKNLKRIGRTCPLCASAVATSRNEPPT